MVNFQGCTSTHNGGKQFVRYAIYFIYGRHFEKQNGGKKEKKIFLLISTISMGQHNNYYAKVCFLPFQSQDPSPPLTLYDPGGGFKSPPLRFFALTHLILELHYCALVTFPKK